MTTALEDVLKATWNREAIEGALYDDASGIFDLLRPPALRSYAPWLDSGWRFHLMTDQCLTCGAWTTTEDKLLDSYHSQDCSLPHVRFRRYLMSAPRTLR